MRDGLDPRGNAPQPWTTDPDAWRGTAAAPPGRPWPQLDAGPLYWMWLELLERERGIES